VLQAQPGVPGAVLFEPELEEKKSALLLLFMGQAVHLSLHFRERWWEQASGAGLQAGELRDMSFLFSHQEWFPTWWTGACKAPVLTAWAASRRAERLAGKSPRFLRDRALESLGSLVGASRSALEAMLLGWYAHDWERDPYARGAYSYVGVNGEGSQAELAQSLAGTLYFAGEATNSLGHHGEVHGAIQTGERAAKEILEACD
jgi:monoamine oxidase